MLTGHFAQLKLTRQILNKHLGPVRGGVSYSTMDYLFYDARSVTKKDKTFSSTQAKFLNDLVGDCIYIAQYEREQIC